jgi:hypothetical protein
MTIKNAASGHGRDTLNVSRLPMDGGGADNSPTIANEAALLKTRPSPREVHKAQYLNLLFLYPEDKKIWQTP